MPRWFLIIAVLAAARAASNPEPRIELGYCQMYDLDFAQAHRTFAELEHERPGDPLVPISNAAARLFEEFDRLHILQSEFFTHDDEIRRSKLTPNPAVREAFDRELDRGGRLSRSILARSPGDEDAMFATILGMGLRADYEALIEKRYISSLRTMKESRMLAERLVAMDSRYYDAYLAVGVENYMLGLKPAPLRWILRWGGAETDKDRGIRQLKLTAEKGCYLRPYARSGGGGVARPGPGDGERDPRRLGAAVSAQSPVC